MRPLALLLFLVARGLRTTNYRGVQSTKTILLRVIRGGGLRFDTLHVRARSVAVHQGTALVIGRMHQVATGPEGRHPSEVAYHRTYRQRDGRWQLVAATIETATR